jgi:hypothetical protein
MRTIETTAVVTPEHTLTIQLPPDVPPGPHRVVVVIEDGKQPPARTPGWKDWPAHNLGPWPEGFTASREQIYGDDGR